jgi:ABC-type transport system substrate-binding protein
MIQGAQEMMAGEADEASGIKVIDALTLEVSLTFPFYEFLQVLTYPAFAPVPSKGTTSDFSNFDVMPIGNGPFKMSAASAWRENALRLERFDSRAGSPALLNAIEFRFYESDSSGAQGSADEEELREVAWRAGVGRAGAGRAGVGRAGTGRSSEGRAGQTVMRHAIAGRPVADERKVAWWPVADEPPMTYEEKTYEDFQLGELDVAQIPAKDLEDARMRYGESLDGYAATPGNQTISGAEACTQFLLLNFAHEPLTDANVRTALSYAINREAICEELYLNTCAPATGIVPPGVKGFRDDVWPAATYRVNRAKRALSDAGYPGGEGLAPITLVVPDTENDRKLFEMIEADLKVVGFKVKIATVKTSTQFDNVLGNSASLAIAGWITDFPVMESFLTSLFTSFGVYNQFGYYNAQVDESIMAARAIADEAERIKAFQEVDDIIAADMPVIPLFFTRYNLVCSDRLNDFYIAPDGMVDFPKLWVSS